jgi:hypothetical protein
MVCDGYVHVRCPRLEGKACSRCSAQEDEAREHEERDARKATRVGMAGRLEATRTPGRAREGVGAQRLDGPVECPIGATCDIRAAPSFASPSWAWSSASVAFCPCLAMRAGEGDSRMAE